MNMKTTITNHLRKDVKVLGRSVPVFLILLVAMSGLGAAALISMYGSASGTTTVQQSVTLNGQDYDQSQSFDLDGQTFVAGTNKMETHYLKNNANVPETVAFNTTCSNTDGQDGAPQQAHDIDWSTVDGDNCDGITTQYLEYFDDAGHDFSGYSAPSGDLVVDADDNSNYDEIQPAINDASSGDVILVKDGTYSGSVEVNKSDLTVVAANSPMSSSPSVVSGAKTGFRVTAEGVTIKGFEVTAHPSTLTPNARGIEVHARDVTVTSNYVHDVVAEERPIGIFVYGDSGLNVNNTAITNNRVEHVQATELSGSVNHGESKTRGVVLEGDSSNANGVEISYNTISDIGNDTHAAMSNGVEIYGGKAEDFVVTFNDISDVDHNEDFGYTPTAGGFYVTGYQDSGDAYGSNHKIRHNNFVLAGTDHTADVKDWNGDRDNERLDAHNNWWDTDGIQLEQQDTMYSSSTDDIAVSYKIKSDMTLEGGEKDYFGMRNIFAINLAPDDYTLTLSVVPQ